MQTILCENCNASIEVALPDIDTQHLRSKVILSDGEILETKKLVKQDEEVLKRYDAELKRLRGLVEKLEEGRLIIEERLREHRGILSLLRRLPVEILDKVFTLVCLGKDIRRHEGYSLRISSSSKRIPIRAPAYDLSHISSSWRRIVTSRPHLWTSIHLDINGVHCDVRPLLEIYLKNSGTRPLKIKIVEKGKDDRPERWLTSDLIYATHFVGEHGLNAFRTLFTHMPRCSDLELDVNWEVLSNDGALQWNHVSFPILRTFRNSIDTGLASATVPGPTAWFWNALRNAPNLRDVHADRVLPPHLDMIPYHQLTCLQISAVDGIRRLFYLLQDSPHLQLLKIWYLDPNDDEEDTPVHIELPRLRSLSIDTAGDYPLDRFSTLFASLMMPNLESLRIENSYSPVDIQYSLPTSFFTMLQHSSASLRKLTLDLEDTCLADHTLVNILRILPSLTRFEVMLDGHSDLQARPSPCIAYLLDKLTISAGSSSSCSILAPKLARLFLHENSSRLNAKIVKLLLDMAESRSQYGLASLGRSHDLVPFHKVQLTYAFAWLDSSDEEEHELPPRDFNPFCDPSVAERINLLKEDGTKCIIEESD
ncbi:hypothetical protein Moror_1611 [Moniliophthora roreri MCA 2997]|uniref:F-box domain-containing protein n=2 Tax=Moniliophthora roreri TaxID=221103 RepID=V2XM97_MONRO|nr:hypothetical protein Moror_1611 [Moniliophthora roreri MCA 2997]KAI3611038.1 hypothetical protein WG66_013805 [Moniliophthora roreri]